MPGEEGSADSRRVPYGPPHFAQLDTYRGGHEWMEPLHLYKPLSNLCQYSSLPLSMASFGINDSLASSSHGLTHLCIVSYCKTGLFKLYSLNNSLPYSREVPCNPILPNSPYILNWIEIR